MPKPDLFERVVAILTDNPKLTIESDQPKRPPYRVIDTSGPEPATLSEHPAYDLAIVALRDAIARRRATAILRLALEPPMASG